MGPLVCTVSPRIWELPVGIVANNGIPVLGECIEGRTSSSVVVQPAASRSFFLQNITGFMVGRRVRGTAPASPGRRQDGDGGGLLGGAKVYSGSSAARSGRQLR